MEAFAMKLRAIALLILLPFVMLQAPAALAAEEPDAVYAKFHRAAMAGDLEEMLKYGPAQRRNEIRGMSAASKDAALKMAQFMMPRAFTVERTMVAGNGGRATLIVSGPGDAGGGKLEKIYGTVRMLMENGEWKVDEASWSSEKPSILASPAPAAARPAADKSPAKGAASAKAAPAASAYTETPARKLGEAKAECVYKPVMTAKDIENCK
jgi:hypothetical protein